VLLGEFDREAQAFGLATTAGTVSHTGVGGLTLGGGFGRLCRKYRLSCDNLLSAEAITADGRFLRASDKENADLMWGLRGGGGNFGVVTSFDFQLYPIGPTLLGGVLIYPFEQARALLKFFAGFAPDSPDELNADFAVTTVDGHRVAIIDACWCGSIEAGQRALQPLRDFAKPLQDLVRPAPYVQLQSEGDGPAYGPSYYIKAGFIRHIEPALIDELLGRFEASPLDTLTIVFPHQGGAVNRVKPNATAFTHRNPNHSVILFGSWTDKAAAEPTTVWIKDAWKVAEPYTDGFYVNEVAADDTQKRVLANYGTNLDRLVALKTKYDPGNLFRMNANIKPREAQKAA